jgi:hypothetical protein
MPSEIRVDTIKSASAGISTVSVDSGLFIANAPFIEMGQTVSANYTIGPSRNALTAGPVTINDGITVTIPSGSNWVIV